MPIFLQLDTKNDILFEYNSFSSYKHINVHTTVHLKKQNITLLTNFINLKYNIYYIGTGTYNYKSTSDWMPPLLQQANIDHTEDTSSFKKNFTIIC
jgi:hypothetical protein